MRNGALLIVTMALLPATPALAQAPCEPDAPLRPIMATHTLPPWPEMSVMTNESGTSLLQVDIGADGVPTNTSVVQSSSSLRLDDTAKDYVKDVWRWRAPVKDCKPVPSVTRVSINWSLRDAPNTGPAMPMVTLGKPDYPPDAFERREQGMSLIAFVLLEKGGTARVQIAKSSGFADLDGKAQELALTRYRWTPAMLDGKPVNTQMYLAVKWQLEPAQAASGH